ncbi:hypothetical protein IWW45_008400 [Coemansia sp. RSA 485]|nr:hypothetical protein IWW45_008400 [Coemansia sp. RSA 485]
MADQAPTMKAVVFKKPYSVAYQEVPRPTEPGEGEAIVRVMACGLCGSDIHPYRGAEKGLQRDTVCGHEFAGIVEEVGQGVQLKPGQRVAASFTTACGHCWFCSHGLSSRCDTVQLFGWINEENSCGIHGGQAQFVRVPYADGTLMVLPDHVSFEEGVLVGDIFSTGYFCAKNALSALSDAKMAPSEMTVAVVGCGPVGLCAIISARLLGVETVYAIDRVQSRLNLAKNLGAIAIAPGDSPIDAACAASATRSGRGVDAALEVVGAYDALDLCFRLVRPGGVVSSVGVHAHDKGFPISPEQCYDKNITFRSGRCPARSLMSEVCSMLDKADISRVISHRVPLSSASEMYAKFESQAPGVFKVIFDPWA